MGIHSPATHRLDDHRHARLSQRRTRGGDGAAERRTFTPASPPSSHRHAATGTPSGHISGPYAAPIRGQPHRPTRPQTPRMQAARVRPAAPKSCPAPSSAASAATGSLADALIRGRLTISRLPRVLSGDDTSNVLSQLRRGADRWRRVLRQLRHTRSAVLVPAGAAAIAAGGEYAGFWKRFRRVTSSTHHRLSPTRIIENRDDVDSGQRLCCLLCRAHFIRRFSALIGATGRWRTWAYKSS